MSSKVNPSTEGRIADFLSQRRIAIAGASRKSDGVGNIVYKKLKSAGYEVVPINPRAVEIEGDPCFANLEAVPGGVDAVFVATPPDASADVVRECAELGVKRVWLHRSFGVGSVSDEAVAAAREAGIEIIPGACPMMYCDPVDIGHKCIRWVLGVTGKLPSV